MIEWWWVPVVLLVTWVPLLVIAAFKDQEVYEAAQVVLFTVVSLPLLPIVAVLSRLDVGVVPLAPRALERFVGMRTADKRPAFLFYTHKTGVIVLREWDVESHRRKVELRVLDDDPLIGGGGEKG